MVSSSTVVVLLLWVISSCTFSTYANTTFLEQFNDASALTFIRFLGSCVFGLFSNVIFGSLTIKDVIKYIPQLIIPSLALLGANFFNSVALNLTGISVTYITKSTIPIWTALITLFIYKQKPSTYKIYLSLIPTVIGVAMTSLSDIDFNLIGFIAALSSTISQTLFNILSRNIVNSSKLSGSQFQFIMVTINSIILFPIYLLTSNEFSAIYNININYSSNLYDNYSAIVFIMAPLAYHIEYVLNCMLVGEISSLAFSMTDITRRLGIIISGSILFDKTLNLINKIGIILALGGVAMYSYLTNSKKTQQEESAITTSKGTTEKKGQ